MNIKHYLLLSLFSLSLCYTYGQFDPVSLEAEDAKIRLSVLGSFRGMTFARNTPASPPAYDPISRKLFIGSVDENVVDVLDIHDPTLPQKISSIDLSPFGVEGQAIAVKNGILAVAVLNPNGPVNTTNVVFFDIHGNQLADPIFIDGEANKIAFTPNGRVLAVSITGRPSDDYTIDPEGGVAVIELFKENIFRTYLTRRSFHCGNGYCDLQPTVTIANFSGLNGREEELNQKGVRIFGPGASAAQDLEPQSLTVDEFFAYVSLTPNNAIAIVSLPFKRLVNVSGLGEKDHSLEENAIDVSDRDGIINITTWPLTSLYGPDGIKTYRRGFRTFIVTANEGDPRDFDGFSEIERGEDLVLDTIAFPNAAELQARENLGRLRLTKVNTDTDGDGDIDRLVTIGSRSFSIRDIYGRLIFDSGSDFETITAEAIPEFFNAASDENNFDNRSDDRGPEPEPLDLGRVGRRTYAFVGFERISGVMAYDITDPYQPSFQQYINNRNFAIDPDTVCEKEEIQSELCRMTGDLEVEGILFISKRHSPIRKPLLVVAHEASNSVTLYQIERIRPEKQFLEVEEEEEHVDQAAMIQQFQALHQEAGIDEVDLFSQAVPNPFILQTSIQFYLVSESSVTVDILNNIGQTVRAFDLEDLPEGEHEILWDGTDQEGHEVVPGMYIYRIKTAYETYTNKVIKSE